MTEVLEEIGLFHKYPSIENSYREEFIEKIKLQGYADQLFCITEKIHGSNTQVCYDYKTKEFEYGKRTCKIEENEKCYNVQLIFEKIKEQIVELADLIAKEHSNLATVIVYGEVFGGQYPHADVAKDNKASKVQKGVYYSPHNEWKAFDIAYTLIDDERTYFVSGSTFYELCNSVGIDTVPLLKVADNLNEALEYPNDGESVVYESYGLPKLENNIMEGVVIKPWTSDSWMGQTRVVLKNKNEKFAEKSHEKKINIQVEVPENVKQAISEVQQFITEARVHNVISHLGEVTIQDVGKVIGLTAKDVLEDYKKEYGTLNTMEKAEEKMVTKAMQFEVAKVVKKVMLR